MRVIDKEWSTEPLGDLVEILSSKRIFAADYVESGIPFYRSKEVIERAKGMKVSTELFITHDRFNEIKSKYDVPVDGDLLISAVGERAGIPYVVNGDGDFYFKDGNLIWFKKFSDKLNSQFLSYYLESRIGQYQLESLMIGSAQKALTIIGLKGLDITIPTPFEQKEIATILSTLDQKIALLKKQNQTLEELAQTLFKRWFVDFEFPLIKKDGTLSGAETYKSSGGKMIASELGEIPEGWSVGEVGDFVTHSTKSVVPNKTPEINFWHYSIPAYDNGRFPTLDTGESILSNKYIVKDNSILVSKLNPSTSRIWTVFKPNKHSICSTEIQVFIPNTDYYSFAFGLFHSIAVKREMAQRASGTSSSHQRVRPSDILNIEVINPEDEVVKMFNTSVLESLRKTELNHNKIQLYIQLRDTLLPKLMSGSLEIKTENE